MTEKVFTISGKEYRVPIEAYTIPDDVDMYDEFKMAGFSEQESAQMRYICDVYGLEPTAVISAVRTLNSLFFSIAKVEKSNPQLRYLAFRSKKFRVRKKNLRRYAQCIGSNY